MGRAVTKNVQGELTFDETFNFSGSNPTISSVKLIAKDGQEVKTENPSWLGFTQSTSGSDLTVTLQLDATGLETYTTYTFRIETQDDAGNQKSRRVNVGIGSLATSFDFKGIMGQEDKGRTDAQGDRIERGGTARVIVTTTMEATLDIEYVGNPANEDDPTFQQSQQGVSSQTRFHEFFFPVNPSSLYAFRVTADADYDDSVPTITSDVYYFVTGDQITFRDANFNMSASITLLGGIDTTLSETIGSVGDSTASKDTPDAEDTNFGISNVSLVEIGTVSTTITQTIDDSVLTTSTSTA